MPSHDSLRCNMVKRGSIDAGRNVEAHFAIWRQSLAHYSEEMTAPQCAL
jgi:hypothetical protein